MRVKVAFVTELPEEVELAVLLVLLEFDDRVDGVLVDGHQRPPGVPQFVEPAGLDQRFDHPLVAHQQGRLVEEVVEVLGLAHPARSAVHAETTLSPTLRTAPSPKRMSVPTGVKAISEELMSGDKMIIIVQ